MTQKLEMLKGVLQKVLGESVSESFREAIADGVYACTLSVVGLEQWIHQWVSWQADNTVNRNDDHDYLQGVQFVADEWDKILSEDNEGEGL